VLRSLDDDVYLGAAEAMHGVVRTDADVVDGGRDRQALKSASVVAARVGVARSDRTVMTMTTGADVRMSRG
jgi:hypothetical protein